MRALTCSTSLLLLLAIPGLSAADCSSPDKSILAFMPSLWEFYDWGGVYQNQVGTIFDYSNEPLEIPADSISVFRQGVLNDDPPSLADFVANAHRRYRAYQGHSTVGGVIGINCLTEDGMLDEFDELYALGFSSGEFDYWRYDKPSPAGSWIARWTLSSIEQRVRPKQHPEAIDFICVCSGSHHRDSWGVYPQFGTRTFLGFDQDVLIPTAAMRWADVHRTLGCEDHPCRGNDVEDTVVYRDPLLCDGSRAPLFVYGKGNNRLVCGLHCWPWLARITWQSAFSGQVHFVTMAEDSDKFKVRAYASPSTSEYTVEASFQGVPANGVGRYRLHSVPVPSGYAEFAIESTDTDGRSVVYDRFGWSEEPTSWSFWQDMDGRLYDGSDRPAPTPAPLLEFVQGELVNPRQGNPLVPPADSLCADVVVYSSSQSFINRTMEHLESYNTPEQGYNLKVRGFVGSEAWEDARAALVIAKQDNADFYAYCQEYGPCTRQYPAVPRLFLVGVPNFVEDVSFPDDEHGSCSIGSCHGYGPIADFDDDQKQDNNVHAIPAYTSEELDLLLSATDEYNQGLFVDEGESLALFMDNTHDQEVGHIGGTIPLMLTPTWIANGLNVRGEYRHSEYVNATARQAAGITAINDGVGVVVAMGYDTAPSNLTHFLGVYNNNYWEELTTKQRYILIAPTCFGGALWMTPPNIAARQAMLRHPDGSVAVAVMGHATAGQEDNHLMLLQAIIDALESHIGERVPWGDIFNDAIQSLPPELDHYAAGLVYGGGWALTSGTLEEIIYLPDTLPLPQATRLWSSTHVSAGVTSFHLQLPSDRQVSLEVYDVMGRLVDRIFDHKSFQAGRHKLTWKHPRELSQGIYFLQLEAGSEQQSLKFAVVR